MNYFVYTWNRSDPTPAHPEPDAPSVAQFKTEQEAKDFAAEQKDNWKHVSVRGWLNDSEGELVCIEEYCEGNLVS